MKAILFIILGLSLMGWSTAQSPDPDEPFVPYTHSDNIPQWPHDKHKPPTKIKISNGFAPERVLFNLQRNPNGLKMIRELLAQGDVLLQNQEGDSLLLAQGCMMCFHCCNTSDGIGCPTFCEGQIPFGRCGECCDQCDLLQSWVTLLYNQGLITRDNFESVLLDIYNARLSA